MIKVLHVGNKRAKSSSYETVDPDDIATPRHRLFQIDAAGHPLDTTHCDDRAGHCSAGA